MAIILRWSGFLNMPRESAVSGAGAGLLASAVGTRPVAVTPQRKSPPLVVSWYVLLHGRHPIIRGRNRSEEHTSELQSLMRISYAVFCLKKKNTNEHTPTIHLS